MKKNLFSCHFSFSTTFPLIYILGFNQMGWHLTCVASFTSSPSNIVDQFRKISLQNGLNLVEIFWIPTFLSNHTLSSPIFSIDIELTHLALFLPVWRALAFTISFYWVNISSFFEITWKQLSKYMDLYSNVCRNTL